ncbi:hypothetical protein AJ78_02253 [Emergomyces pasteurianus Ep9510]|uniref:DUF6593 domain-containing protein n=1 Tax=Emergomyces pasteurianus Ep9510 TaxID=1447872 RepID=A0A1J9PNE3_9EURO|nr:hypothetical protein AJ78_02253 [Emergomyces pasteurianus Ep9510]
MACAQPPIRRVHIVKEKSWTRLSYKIITPDDVSCLYTVTTSSGHPEVTLTRHLRPIPHTQSTSSMPRLSGQFSLSSLLGQSRHHHHHHHHYQHQDAAQFNNDHVVGTATFHTFSSKIDICLSTNHAITMKCPDLFTSSRRFESLTPLGTLEWKREGLVSSNLKLVDESGRTVARYEKHWSLLSKQSDAITLLVPELDGFLDIVIITCMATIEYKRVEDEVVAEAAGGI